MAARRPLTCRVLLLASIATIVADAETINVDADNFLTEVAKDDVAWLLHFTSTKCESAEKSPCVTFAPEWQSLTKSLKRLKIGRIDIDTEKGKSMAQNFGIFNEGIPNVKLLKTQKPPAVTLMAGTPLTMKKMRKLISNHMKGFQKDAMGYFLKAKKEEEVEEEPELDRALYDVLEVEPTASKKEIKKAYRKLSLQYHPDKNPAYQAKFNGITTAYETLGESDLRRLYDAYGQNYGDPNYDMFRQMKMKSKHKELTFFKDVDGIRNWLSKDGDELEKGLKKHLVIFAYHPYQVKSQHIMVQWKLMPDLVGDVADIGAINCDSETLCREFGVTDVPSIQVWALGDSAIDTYDSEIFDADRIAFWLKANLLGRDLITDITKENFEQTVLNSKEAWIVVWCSHPARYPICMQTRKQFNRLAYVFKPLGVKMGRAYCAEEKKEDGVWLDEWCEVDIGVSSLGENMPWNFPFVKVYKRGGDKRNGEQINLNVMPPKFQGDRGVPDQILEIVERVMIAATPDDVASHSGSEDGDEDDPLAKFNFDEDEDEDEDEPRGEEL